MTLQQTYYSTEIADAGSIDRAVEKLFLSQPTLTDAVKEAREELGFRLLNRNSHDISLTPDGTEFLAYTKEPHQRYKSLMDHSDTSRQIWQRFSISTQYYSLVA